jgi:hypothetical protein
MASDPRRGPTLSISIPGVTPAAAAGSSGGGLAPGEKLGRMYVAEELGGGFIR